MSHAELIHFPLEVPFRTQRRSERSLLGVPLQERGRAAVDFPIFALASFMQHEMHLHSHNGAAFFEDASFVFENSIPQERTESFFSHWES